MSTTGSASDDEVMPVAVLAETVLEEADDLYSVAFDRGQRVADSRR